MAGIINERHISTDRAGGGNFPTLFDVLNHKRQWNTSFVEGGISANGQFVLISTTVITGNIAIGTSTTTDNGGYLAALLAGAVGTAATTTLSNSRSVAVNKCIIRDASTNDPILDSSGRQVYGLLQASSTVTDGDAIGAPASENLQVSFVVEGSDSTLSLVSVTGTIEIAFPIALAFRHEIELEKVGTIPSSDIIVQSSTTLQRRVFAVTAAFAANEVITLSTGSGSGSGTSTPSGDSITSIGADASTFNTTNSTKVYLYGIDLLKGTDVVWDSTTTFHISQAMDVGDWFAVEVQV